MKINKLYINHFGKLSNKTITFTDGINVVSGENEAGKSTLHSFIKAMIFGLERGRGRAAAKDDYTRFKPWDGGSYAGKIEVTSKGKEYSITRNFDKESQSCIVANETDFLEEEEEKVLEIFGGISPSSFQNTISVKQLSVGTGGELADELKNHIINLRTAGAYTLNISGAISNLKAKRKRAEGTFSKNTQLESEELNARIASMEAELAKDDNASDLLKLEKEKENLEKKIYSLEVRRGEASSTLNRGEEKLRRAHIAGDGDIDALREDIEEVADYYDNHKDKFSAKKSGKIFFTVLALLTTLLVIGVLGAGIYLYLYGFERKLVYVSAAVLVLLLVLDIIFIKKSQASRSFKESKKLLSNLYRNIYGSEPEDITDAEVEKLRNVPDKIRTIVKGTTEAKIELENIQDELISVREGIEPLSEALEIARKDAWAREQKEEALFSLRDRQSAISQQLEINRKAKSDVEALTLAIGTIEKISKDVFDSFGHFLQDTTSGLIRSMTDGNYSGVSITDTFDIALMQGDRRVELSSVSGGTLDQVYLALRLACIEFMWPDEAMPLMLDDTFAMYDGNRLACTLEWLSENYSGQVIIFTCHQREEKKLDNLNIPYNLIEL